MARVLIVDDEQGYCDNLERASKRVGHDVQTAGTASEAIEIGARYQPDVLVVDWMLPSSLHGLHVSDTLRMVHPSLRTILITGFGSPDLRLEAQRSGVTQFLDKPFTLDEYHTSLKGALEREPVAIPLPEVALLDVDHSGAILHATPHARQLMATTHAGRTATHVEALFGREALAHIWSSVRAWTTVAPLAEGGATWRMRARALPSPGGDGAWTAADAARGESTGVDGGGWLVLLRDGNAPPLENLATVRILLNESRIGPVQWPREGHVLIVDGHTPTRRLCATALRQVGCVCHTATDRDMAERLICDDRQIDLALISVDPINASPTPWQPAIALMHSLRRIRNNLTIVAVSRYDVRDAFKSAGVDHFLRTPWGIEDLINSLTGRIGNCVDCGLPIPLRRAKANEVASHWECAGCGSRYSAMFDDSAPDDIRRHARLVVKPAN